MPHLYQTKFYVLNFYFQGEANTLSYLIYLNFFLKFVLRGEARVSPLQNKILCFRFCDFVVRHMPHPI